MKPSLSTWLLAVSLSLPGAALANDSDNIKLVTTGQITSVDAKHNTFQFKFRLDQPGFNRAANRQYPGGRRQGGIGGRHGRIGGYPGRPGGLADDMKEVKVFVSDDTKLKDTAGLLQFSNLKAGDRTTIVAIRKGHGDDLQAQVVTRN